MTRIAHLFGYDGATKPSGPGAGETAPDRGQHLAGGAVMAHGTCSIVDCNRPLRCKGLCGAHYKRLLKFGDPLGAATPRTRHVTAQGYVRVNVPGHPMANDRGWAPEHRVVAWDHYGPFDPRMHVHHINHDRQDNRPSNLEILTPEDHMRQHGEESRRVDHAEIVRLYQEGHSTPDVGRMVGLDASVVYRTLVKLGVPVRSISESRRTPIDDDELRRLHASPGARVPQIADALGVGHQVVRRRMRELGLPAFPTGRWAHANPEAARAEGLMRSRLAVES